MLRLAAPRHATGHGRLWRAMDSAADSASRIVSLPGAQQSDRYDSFVAADTSALRSIRHARRYDPPVTRSGPARYDRLVNIPDSKQAPTRTPGPAVSRGCSAFVAVVALLPAAITVGAVVPLGRALLVRPEEVKRTAGILVGHRAALQLGPVGFGFLAERTHRVLQPRSGSRVCRPRRDACWPAVPIDHIGGPACCLSAYTLVCRLAYGLTCRSAGASCSVGSS